MMKVLKVSIIDELYLQIIKAIYRKPIVNIILNGDAESICSKIKNKTRIHTLPTLL